MYRNANKHYKKLNKELAEATFETSLVDNEEEIALCRELIHDGLLELIQEDEDGKEIYVKLTAEGLVFRRNGGYKTPKPDLSVANLIIAIIAAIAAIIAALKE